MKRGAASWIVGAMLSGLVGLLPAEVRAQPPGSAERNFDPPAEAAAEAPAPPATRPPAASLPAAAPAPAAPPGYVLVPQNQVVTRYDVQYPQTEGALPPNMELPYEDGQKVPDGYRLVSRPRRGLVIAGAVVTGALWALSLTMAVAADFEKQSGWLAVPGAGPWLMLAAGGAKNECHNVAYGSGYSFRSCTDNSSLRAALTLDGIGQTAGVVMFISGFAFASKRLVRDDVTVAVLPTRVGRDGYGLGVLGAF